MRTHTAPSRQRHRSAFTLLELAVTTVMLGILALVGTLSYRAVTDNTRDSAVRASLASVAQETFVNARRDYSVDRTDIETALTSLGSNWTVLAQSAQVVTPGQVGWIHDSTTRTAGLVTKSSTGKIVQACVTADYTSTRILPNDASPTPADALPCSAPSIYETAPYPLAGGGMSGAGAGSETAPTAVAVARTGKVGIDITPGSRNWLMWQIERDGGGAGTSASTFWDFGRTNGTTYTYRVRGYDAVTGETGTWSASVSATPLQEPTVTATPGATSVTLTWTAVAGTAEYRIAWYERSQLWTGAYLTTTATTYTVSGLAPGVAYTFAVAAADPATNAASSWGQTDAATTAPSGPPTAGTPSAPTALVATDGTFSEGYLTDGIGGLTWNTPASNGGSPITGYKVQYRLAPTGTWTQYTETASPGTAVNIWWAPTGAPIYWRVAAVNTNGTGPYSDPYTTYNYYGG